MNPEDSGSSSRSRPPWTNEERWVFWNSINQWCNEHGVNNFSALAFGAHKAAEDISAKCYERGHGHPRTYYGIQAQISHAKCDSANHAIFHLVARAREMARSIRNGEQISQDVQHPEQAISMPDEAYSFLLSVYEVPNTASASTRDDVAKSPVADEAMDDIDGQMIEDESAQVVCGTEPEPPYALRSLRRTLPEVDEALKPEVDPTMNEHRKETSFEEDLTEMSETPAHSSQSNIPHRKAKNAARSRPSGTQEKAARHPGILTRPLPNESPTRAYLNEQVTPHLLDGMKYLAVNTPEKPLNWLSEFMAQKSGELEGP